MNQALWNEDGARSLRSAIRWRVGVTYLLGFAAGCVGAEMPSFWTGVAMGGTTSFLALMAWRM